MSKNRLMLEMSIFAILLFIACSFLVINERKNEYLIPNIDQKLKEYIKEEYPKLTNEISIHKTVYNKKKATFFMRVENKNNKNLYFIVSYKDKKITSSYKIDYLEGKTLLSSLEKELENQLNKKMDYNITIHFTKKLNEYNSPIYDRLISNDYIQELNIYNVKVELESDDFKVNSLIASIGDFYNSINHENYHPNYYQFRIIHSKNITQEIKIEFLDSRLITYNLEEIIEGIIQKNPSIDSKFNIKHEYTE
ncbi:MAG: hypothetical protein HFJ12_04335 [Bacilli bacterium]|nr:hypothetical protein [Bacilli bacterium]